MSRAALLVLLTALGAGLGLGLYAGWVVSPVRYVDADPASLAGPVKDDYVLMIAALYAQDADQAAAQDRLAALGFGEPGLAVAEATLRLMAAGGPEADLRRLARLAAALGAATPEMQPYLP